MTGISAEQLEPPSLSAQDDYLSWTPLAHLTSGCSDGWQVRTYQRDTLGDSPVPIAMRACCTGCGASYELAAMTHFQDQWGNRIGPGVTRDYFRGCATKPVRVMGHWLHAVGARQLRDDPYWEYYLTADRAQPTTTAEVLGKVSRVQTRQGHWRWTAHMVTAESGPTRTWLTATTEAPKKFTTHLAGARWIVRTLQASEADSST